MSKRTLMQLIDSGELPTVRGRGRQGRLLRDDAEAYAAAHFRLRRYRRSDSYFVTTAGVAELLGISRPRVIQLGDKGFLPYLVAGNGWRLYRRQQIEVVANSRLARGFGVGLATNCDVIKPRQVGARLDVACIERRRAIDAARYGCP